MAENDIGDYPLWQRMRIFFIRRKYQLIRGDMVLHYKIYRGARVVISEDWKYGVRP